MHSSTFTIARSGALTARPPVGDRRAHDKPRRVGALWAHVVGKRQLLAEAAAIRSTNRNACPPHDRNPRRVDAHGPRDAEGVGLRCRLTRCLRRYVNKAHGVGADIDLSAQRPRTARARHVVEVDLDDHRRLAVHGCLRARIVLMLRTLQQLALLRRRRRAVGQRRPWRR